MNYSLLLHSGVSPTALLSYILSSEEQLLYRDEQHGRQEPDCCKGMLASSQAWSARSQTTPFSNQRGSKLPHTPPSAQLF